MVGIIIEWLDNMDGVTMKTHYIVKTIKTWVGIWCLGQYLSPLDSFKVCEYIYYSFINIQFVFVNGLWKLPDPASAHNWHVMYMLMNYAVLLTFPVVLHWQP